MSISGLLWELHSCHAGACCSGSKVELQGQPEWLIKAEHRKLICLNWKLCCCGCRSVLAWRKWFHKEGRSGFWAQSRREATPAPDLAREQLLDRYHQHTQNCPACSKVCGKIPLHI